MRHPSEGSRRLILIVGNSGTGKTVTLRTISREWNRRFHFDRSAELLAEIDVECTARTRGEVLDYLSGLEPDEACSVAYQPIIEETDERAQLLAEAAEAGFLARLAMKAERCLFTVDEAAQSCRHGYVHPDTKAIALEGRKHFVSGIFSSQRPFHIAPDIRTEAYGSEAFVFRLKRKDDREDIDQEHGKELSEIVSRLPNRHGIHLFQDENGLGMIERVRVFPDSRAPRIETSPWEAS